jgi:3-deoxy-D-manno-octulosonic-acid transferase
MLMTIYKGLTGISAPLLEIYLRGRMARGKEDPARQGERRGKASLARPAGKLVWLHAASVGESLSLLAVIRRLRADHPDARALVTTGTVTSAKLMAERLPEGAFHQYMPVDHPAWVKNFLDHWRPGLVVWSESELWPNMLAGVKKRGIPAVLLNARMSEKSFRRWQCAPGMARALLGAFSLCLAQNDAEAARLKELGAADVRLSGNLKYAAAPLPCDEAKLESLKHAVEKRPHLLWASTHPGEEEIALRLHARLKAAFPELLSIIVPRHPARGPAVAEMAKTAGFAAGLRSAGQSPRREDDVYIADTLGELGLFYRLSPLCIMGGSFVGIGGHNPIEPAQLGCLVFYGPFMFNFVSICHDFESRNAAVPVRGEEALEKEVARALREPAHFAPVAAAAKAWTAQQAHVVDEIAAALAPFVKEAAA